jgi:hypothetical protein
MVRRGVSGLGMALAVLVAGAMGFSDSLLGQSTDAAYENALRAYVSTLDRLAATDTSEPMRRVYAADEALTLMRLADLAERRGASAESTRLTSDAVAACAAAGLPYCTSVELRVLMRTMDAQPVASGLPGEPPMGYPLLLDASHLASAPVRYSAQAALQSFPVPVVHWRRAGLMAGEAEAEEIKSKLIYPVLLDSKKPVAAFIVEFLPTDAQQIGVTVLWTSGETAEAAIARSPQGKYAADAYRVFFAKPTP